ncbi:hypothetical protein BDW22DRAFT_1423443 [Trametopsis cervina]|nr:hypothetical protein BDW22DRAFT_1423443 [Trametopsis cervina]
MWMDDEDLQDACDGDSSPLDLDENPEVEELEGHELDDSLEKREDLMQAKSSAFSLLMSEPKTIQQWKKIERTRLGGYNGLSARTNRYHKQKAREKEEKDSKTRATFRSPQASAFRAFFKSELAQPRVPATSEISETGGPKPPESRDNMSGADPLDEFLSDMSEDGEDLFGSDENVADDWYEDELGLDSVNTPATSRPPDPIPDPSVEPTFTASKKRRRLEIPARVTRARAAEAIQAVRQQALKDVDRLLASHRQHFQSGNNGLQARRTRTIQSCLHMMVHGERRMMAASRIAAEANGFAVNWGSRLARKWTQAWIKNRALPTSNRGQHAKITSIFSDPTVRAAMSNYMRSHKWSVDPGKLYKLLNNELDPNVADDYAKVIVSQEMPHGLKNFVETEVLPRLQLKPKRLGLSLSTMRRIMLREGFSYMKHKKAVYFDGHERPDVVHDRQMRFIPSMEMIRPRLVKYATNDVTQQLPVDPVGQLLPRLVLVAHDEMTAQAHDGVKQSWVLDGEMPLKKKGAGRGLHQSDFICSTVGWLKDASVTLEYGKNYDGFWNGECFVSQLKEKFFPAFTAAHEPNTIAVILVDNSQGHSAYAEDALRVSRMNLRSGGKQAHMRDGWFMRDGQRITQPMNFPLDHPQYPDQPKGMQQILEERGLWHSHLRMRCKDKCASDSVDCCARQILEHQPDFLEQKSLVQEVIESAGHICIFLPKFHCEMNFIEYFWGAVKRYLREHCDYTFDTLRENMPKALASVPVELIRKCHGD